VSLQKLCDYLGDNASRDLVKVVPRWEAKILFYDVVADLLRKGALGYNLQGHFFDETSDAGVRTLTRQISDERSLMDATYLDGDGYIQQALSLIEAGHVTETIQMTTSGRVCPDCGEYMRIELRGDTLHVGSYSSHRPPLLPCRKPPRFYDMTVEIPSGRMVFANDFRFLFPDVAEPILQGSYRDRISFSRAYEAAGCVMGPTSNVGVYLFETAPNTLALEDVVSEDPESLSGYRGSICMDLWWYCIADGYDVDQRLLSSDRPRPETIEVAVEPGTYVVRHDLRYKDGEPFRFAEICLKKEVDSLRTKGYLWIND